MRYKKLGNSEIDISLISLGAMTFGEQNSQNESFQLMDYAVEKGINFLILLRCIQFTQRKKLMESQKK